MPYNLRANELRLHVKFQPPRFTGLAVHKPQAEVETKRGLANICLDKHHKSDMPMNRLSNFPKIQHGI